MMHIVHITSELTPIAKVGGLADVVHGLSKELIRLGHRVEVVLPKYDCLYFQGLSHLHIEVPELWIDTGSCRFKNTIFSAIVEGIKVFLVEPHHPKQFFNRQTIYGCSDDIARFICFSQVALHFLSHSKIEPDLLHVHDWPTAVIPALCKEGYGPSRTKGTALTLHNMQHQGQCPLEDPQLEELTLLPKTLSLFQEEAGINLLKGGIEYADQLTTVSPQYEKEIQTTLGSCGLQTSVLKRASHLRGILNGIDAQFWDPEKDPHLFKRYNTKTLETLLQGKKTNKRQLFKQLELSDPTQPLVAVIARLVPQKSPHLIKHALHRTLEKGGRFLLLGTSPIPALQEEFETLQKECLKGAEARILMERDEKLAHQIFAAADLFLIPSLFEPCGLTQLIALRYGTVPLARLTGGLVNTVFDIDTSPLPLEKRNGFTFDFPDTEGVDWALLRALDCFRQDRAKWNALMLQGLAYDFSWAHSAPAYVDVYREMLLYLP